ncbi:MAG: acyltransferase [Eubacteriales bacterium]|nr:acyltransferase [Eubacteriales bacterium]
MKRKTSLDLIRCIAILMIVTYHFCVIMQQTDSVFCTTPNGSWGIIGTAMFFMLSGYLLEGKCHREFHIRKFYKSRFLAIFPLFYMNWIVGYAVQVHRYQSYFWGGEPWKLILTVLGVDGYMQWFEYDCYYVVGEWFTAVIIGVYLLFPLLRKGYNCHIRITTVVLTILFVLQGVRQHIYVPADATLLTGLFLVWIGMLIRRYHRFFVSSNGFLAAAAAVLLLELTVKMPGQDFRQVYWSVPLAFVIFTVCLRLFDEINGESRFGWVAGYFSEISYGLYLCHHFLIYLSTAFLLQYMDQPVQLFKGYLIDLLLGLLLAAVFTFSWNKMQLFGYRIRMRSILRKNQ